MWRDLLLIESISLADIQKHLSRTVGTCSIVVRCDNILQHGVDGIWGGGVGICFYVVLNRRGPAARDYFFGTEDFIQLLHELICTCPHSNKIDKKMKVHSRQRVGTYHIDIFKKKIISSRNTFQ